MNNIYRVHTTKTIGFFNNKDDAISLLHHIKDAKVEHFLNLTPVGIYEFKNNQLYYNDEKIYLSGFMNKWFNSTSNQVESNELKLFLPMTMSNEKNTIDFNKFQENIKKLEEEAENHEKNLLLIKEDLKNKEEQIKEKKQTFNKEKKLFDKEKENWNQLRSKLEADKRVYFIIKEQLESGELTENSIPILYQDKYPIFKHMDDHKLIVNCDEIYTEEINTYLDILPKFEKKNPETSYSELFSSSDPAYLFKKNEDNDSSDSE